MLFVVVVVGAVDAMTLLVPLLLDNEGEEEEGEKEAIRAALAAAVAGFCGGSGGI